MNLSIARKGIETLYFDTATIIEYREVTDPDTFQSHVEEVVAYENVPCKLSHVYTDHAKDGVGDGINLVSKLIINPEINVKAGSRIIVTRNGVSIIYKNSGESARFFNHQEIKLMLEEDRA